MPSTHHCAVAPRPLPNNVTASLQPANIPHPRSQQMSPTNPNPRRQLRSQSTTQQTRLLPPPKLLPRPTANRRYSTSQTICNYVTLIPPHCNELIGHLLRCNPTHTQQLTIRAANIALNCGRFACPKHRRHSARKSPPHPPDYTQQHPLPIPMPTSCACFAVPNHASWQDIQRNTYPTAAPAYTLSNHLRPPTTANPRNMANHHQQQGSHKQCLQHIIAQ